MEKSFTERFGESVKQFEERAISHGEKKTSEELCEDFFSNEGSWIEINDITFLRDCYYGMLIHFLKEDGIEIEDEE